MDLNPDLPWRTIRSDGFNGHAGPFRHARAGENEWLTALELQAHHLNSGGVCHGGVLLTLADLGMGAACFDAGDRHPCATIELGAHFIAAAKGGQTVVARAWQDRRAGDLGFMAAELEAGGRLVMRASGIWKYLSSKRPGTETELGKT